MQCNNHKFGACPNEGNHSESTNDIKICFQENNLQKSNKISFLSKYNINNFGGSRDGAVVRALASHQCVPGLIPVLAIYVGRVCCWFLYSAPRGFSPGTPVFPSSQKPTFPNSSSILECTDFSDRVLVNSLVLRG